MTEAFFTPLDDAGDGSGRWLGTSRTTGPWDPRSMHAGPPSALLARALERHAPREGVRVTRVAVEVLGPVPVGEVSVAVRVLRPGRSVELLEASLSAGGREVALARGWRFAVAPGKAPVAGQLAPLPPDLGEPATASWGDVNPGVEDYLRSVRWTRSTGSFDGLGPAAVWTTMLVPLVPDEEPSGLVRALVVADSGNGISAELELASWLFVNTDLVVSLHREPVGPDIALSAHTVVDDSGVGLARSTIWDRTGEVGAGSQTLVVAPR